MSGLSRYWQYRIGASKPVSSFAVTMMIFSGSAGSLNRATTCSSASAPGVHFAQSGESPRDFDITIVEASGPRCLSSSVLVGDTGGLVVDDDLRLEALRLDLGAEVLGDVGGDLRDPRRAS